VGKSTFLNTALGESLAIVSDRPQTTREPLLGVATWKDAEIALIDCPGFHKPHNELGRRMNTTAIDSLHHADLVLLVTDVVHLTRVPRKRRNPRSERDNNCMVDEREIIMNVPESTPCVIVVNKIDLLADKTLLLPFLSELGSYRSSCPIIPVSCLQRHDVERALDVVAPLLPEGERRFPPDTLTDRPVRYFVAEYIREQVIRTTSGEIPFAVAVTLDEYSELPTTTLIKATISVEKDGQRVILIGRGGQQIREIGILSRKRIERLVQKKVYLELFVRTKKQWRDDRNHLLELGYAAPTKSHSGAINCPRGRGRS
jgi:GTP-binding protein Era